MGHRKLMGLTLLVLGLTGSADLSAQEDPPPAFPTIAAIPIEYQSDPWVKLYPVSGAPLRGQNGTLVGASLDVVKPLGANVAVSAGIRADLFQFVLPQAGEVLPVSETVQQFISPRVSLTWTPSDDAELYLDAGWEWWADDLHATRFSARLLGNEPFSVEDPLVRVLCAELGWRHEWGNGGSTTLSTWLAQMNSTWKWAYTGFVEESGHATKRHGYRVHHAQPMGDRWTLEFDYARAESAFRSDLFEVRPVPGSVQDRLGATATFEIDQKWFSALELVHLGDYPLGEVTPIVARGSSVLNLVFGGSRRNVSWEVEISNLLDRDVQISPQTPPAIAELALNDPDLLHHVLEPREVRLQVAWTY